MEGNRSARIVRRLFLVLIVVIAAGMAWTEISAIRTRQAAGNRSLQWSLSPSVTIDRSKIYFATLHTSKGDIRFQLFADRAPLTVNNFIFLAKQGFYDGTTFHRVLKDFMAQGGDPTGTGTGGPGYAISDEMDPALTFSDPGMVAMANSGPDTDGSQFFITFSPQPSLNGKYTIFGKVVDGMSVVLSLRLRDPDQNPDYFGDTINKVTIEEAEPTETPTPLAMAVSPEPQPGRPLAALAPSAREDLYSEPPPLLIDLSHSYQAVVNTTKGNIVIRLFDADAPHSVNNFVILANLGYWDNYPFSQVQTGKWVFSGAPAADAESDIGYSLPAESKRPHEAGAVGYWSSGAGGDSSGSAIYFLLQDDNAMDAAYSVFGKVTDGLDVASTLTTSDRIENISIEEN